MKQMNQMNVMNQKKAKDNLEQVLKLKNQTSNSVDLYIYGDIISKEKKDWHGVVIEDEDTYPKEIRGFLDEANGRDVNIYINSGGGSVFAGVAIASIIKRYEGKTRAYIDGLCGSIATVIFLSADEKYTAENAYFMYHQAMTGIWAYGNAAELTKEVKQACDMLGRVNDGILDTYKSNLVEGADFEVIKSNFDSGEDVWLTGEQICSFFDVTLTEENKAVAYCKSDFFDKYTAPEQLINNQYVDQKDQKTKLADNYMFDF